ncbi:MAG: nucleotidyltransferase domain-containing protein, partial [Desulfatirhabdiaceae bacterium]
KLPADTLDSVPDFIKRVRQDTDIRCAILFGSAATGTLKPLSDIDLAVLLSNTLNKEERIQKQLDLLDICNTVFKTDEIDLVVLNDASPRFVHNILKTGKLLFTIDKNEFIDFRERITREYLDFKFFRNSFEHAFMEGIGYGGRTD